MEQKQNFQNLERFLNFEQIPPLLSQVLHNCSSLIRLLPREEFNHLNHDKYDRNPLWPIIMG